ncbi:hypothetical protein [Streptomonospora wellingtoniae]|uniref:Uncharacterized protein n=1 Tax=Streptomonospora wellingtoniae TaxID=3075544 RepID=A0ABU2L033_9ACTN|nr:hypothetical protein [Streptomonospora sp. DSM 45055]MDT0304909.1 hypothetical protein [Streptomonospora sp. DSM 45055]
METAPACAPSSGLSASWGRRPPADLTGVFPGLRACREDSAEPRGPVAPASSVHA